MSEEILRKLKKSVECRLTYLCDIKNLDNNCQLAKERDFLLGFYKSSLKDLHSFVYE